MVGDLMCPACGETDEIRGRPASGDIRLTCHHCGTTWLRGAPTCRSCGGSEIIIARQAVTRLPRGTLRAIVGMREIPLCPTCDAAVLTGVARNQHVPEDYLSQFLRRSSVPAVPPAEKASAPHTAATPSPQPTRAERPLVRSVPPQAVPPLPPPVVDPTVRVAIDAYLTDAQDQSPDVSADPVTLVLLGQFLGPSTRLSRLEPGTLRDWLHRTWPSARARTRPAATVRGAVSYWFDKSWLPESAIDNLNDSQ
jgi:hypothetical protein